MKLLYFLSISFLIFSLNSKAQTDDNVQFEHYSSSVFDNREASLHLVSNELYLNQQNNLLQSNLRNDVVIQQIGDFNNVNVNLISSNSEVFFNQNGDQNFIMLQKNAENLKQTVMQLGSNNAVFDFSAYTSLNLNMEFVQQGDNNLIMSSGSNTLSRDMKIFQSGSTTGATIYIFNQ